MFKHKKWAFVNRNKYKYDVYSTQFPITGSARPKWGQPANFDSGQEKKTELRGIAYKFII